jgi:hypothetical protein
MLTRIWSSRDSVIAAENAKWCSEEGSLLVSHKTKHTISIQSSNCAPWRLPKGIKVYVHLKSCTQVYSQLEKLRTIQDVNLVGKLIINCVIFR